MFSALADKGKYHMVCMFTISRVSSSFLIAVLRDKYHGHGKDVTLFPHMKQEDKQGFC